MGQMRVRRTGPWVKISCPFSWVQFKFHSGSKLGQEQGDSNFAGLALKFFLRDGMTHGIIKVQSQEKL